MCQRGRGQQTGRVLGASVGSHSAQRGPARVLSTATSTSWQTNRLPLNQRGTRGSESGGLSPAQDCRSGRLWAFCCCACPLRVRQDSSLTQLWIRNNSTALADVHLLHSARMAKTQREEMSNHPPGNMPEKKSICAARSFLGRQGRSQEPFTAMDVASCRPAGAVEGGCKPVRVRQQPGSRGLWATTSRPLAHCAGRPQC